MSVELAWSSMLTEDAFEQVSVTDKKVKSKECLTEGLYPVIDQGRNLIGGYINDPTKIIKVDSPIVVFGDHTRIIKWINFDFVPGADGTKVLIPRYFLDERFFYYQLRSIQIEDRGYGRHFKLLQESSFKVAPLAEQQQIATLLDQHLAQVEQIKARLVAIPALLKKFRQSVLADAVSGKLYENNKQSNYELLPLSKLGNMVGGKTPSKARADYWTNGSISWVSPKDMKQFIIETSEDKITELALKEAGMFLVPEGSVLMVTRSGILAHTFPVALTSNKVTINQDIKAFLPQKSKIDPVFLTLMLRGSGQNILNECSKSGTTVASVETKLLEKFKIRVPSLEEQIKIVRRIEQLFAYSDQIEQRVLDAQKRVNNLTQAILAKAFSGELTAEWRKQNPELISGENSAAALLQRIKAEEIKPVKRGRK